MDTFCLIVTLGHLGSLLEAQLHHTSHTWVVGMSCVHTALLAAGHVYVDNEATGAHTIVCMQTNYLMGTITQGSWFEVWISLKFGTLQ